MAGNRTNSRHAVRLFRRRRSTLTYRDIAVLSRRRVEGVKFYAALRKRGIPCEFVGEVDFFSTAVIRDALAYLHIIENPLKAGVYLNRILKLSGITEVNVQRLNACACLAWDDRFEGDFGTVCSMLRTNSTLRWTHVRESRSHDEGLLQRKDRLTLSPSLFGDLLLRSTDCTSGVSVRRTGVTRSSLYKLYEIAAGNESITKHPSVCRFLDYLDL